MLAVWLWTVLPLVLLHLWMARRRPELLRFQITLDIVLAAVVGPALLLGADLNPVRCLSRNRPFTEWRFADITQLQPAQSDLVLLIHPWYEESRRQLLSGRLPLASERIGGGLPLLANGQVGLFAPCNLPVWALGPERGTTVMAFWKIELAGLGAFLLLWRGWHLRRAAAAMGAVCFAGGAYLVAWLLVPLGWVVVALPWAWWGTAVALRGRARTRRVVGLGVLLGWLLGSGLNPETAVVVIGSALLAGLVLHPTRWRRTLVVAAIAGAVALALAWPAVGAISASAKLELLRSERPNLDRPPPAMRLQAVQQALVPLALGHPGRSDWRAEYPYPAPAVAVGGLALGVLALGSVPRRRRRHLWALLAALLPGAVLLWRVPPLDDLLVRLPVLELMTLPRVAVLVAWGLAGWAALASDPRPARRPGGLLRHLALVAVLAVVALIGLTRGLRAPDGALVALTPVAALAALALLRRPSWLAPAAALELALYAIGINPLAAPSDRLPRPPLIDRLAERQAAEGGRVLALGGMFPANLAARYGLPDLRSADPVRPRPYVRLLAALGDPDPVFGGPLSSAPVGLCGAWSVAFLLTPPDTVAAGWHEVWRDSSGVIWHNPGWLPELRLVGRAAAVADEEGWRLLAADAVDHRREALVPRGTAPVMATRMRLEVSAVGGSRVTARVECDGPCLLHLARPWAPGWRVKVDGASRPLVRANLAGLGVVVPEGAHDVELDYNPWRW